MRNENSLIVAETFYSIQGESSFAGYPCFFIRLAGCNLQCSYCDTPYAQEMTGDNYNIADIINTSERYPHALVEITGGEPLLQKGVYPLMENLLDRGRTVLLETNGSVSMERVPDPVIKIMDLKCPDSGMTDRMALDNIARIRPHDEIKFVVKSRKDFNWAVRIIRDHALTEKAKINISPVTASLPAQELAEWILESRLSVRLQLQLHKILWPDRDRGV